MGASFGSPGLEEFSKKFSTSYSENSVKRSKDILVSLSYA
jgi:hypothetical protein